MMEPKRIINVYLALGSNVGDRLQTLKLAEQMIDRRVGRIARRSSYYETAAWGKTDQDKFINSVIMINTYMNPRQILEENQKIERDLGREISGERWGPRVLDIDILFYGKRVIRDKGLEIPHPEFANRMFVIVPMMEIADHFEHPLLKQDMISLYSECNDTSEVIKLEVEVQRVVKTYQTPKDVKEANMKRLAELEAEAEPSGEKPPMRSNPDLRKPRTGKSERGVPQNKPKRAQSESGKDEPRKPAAPIKHKPQRSQRSNKDGAHKSEDFEAKPRTERPVRSGSAKPKTQDSKTKSTRAKPAKPAAQKNANPYFGEAKAPSRGTSSKSIVPKRAANTRRTTPKR